MLPDAHGRERLDAEYREAAADAEAEAEAMAWIEWNVDEALD
jgi:hypothetical protein